jgi:predicted phosphodiesterase
MRKMKEPFHWSGHWAVLLIALGCMNTAVLSQDKPFVVHDTRPVILNGPYLVSPSETGVTLVWRTDTPCHSKVVYGINGRLTEVAELERHGLLQVGRLHTIRLNKLQPSKQYSYKVVSTRVVQLKPYWPEKGLTIESPVYTFETIGRDEPKVRFSFITDTQYEDLHRLEANLDLVGWDRTDFLVHGGDALDWVEDEKQIFEVLMQPISKRLSHTIPFVFVRGNHDMRGPYARSLYHYLPTQTGQFYYTFDAGPAHVIVLDTGEDKADDTNVYAGLNRMSDYRERELAWLREHVRTSERNSSAPFRIIFMHSPHWGWVDEQGDRWTELANEAGIDLIVAGHYHRLTRISPGEQGNDYTVLVVDQDQVASVEVTQEALSVIIKGEGGAILETLTLQARNQAH